MPFRRAARREGVRRGCAVLVLFGQGRRRENVARGGDGRPLGGPGIPDAHRHDGPGIQFGRRVRGTHRTHAARARVRPGADGPRVDAEAAAVSSPVVN